MGDALAQLVQTQADRTQILKALQETITKVVQQLAHSDKSNKPNKFLTKQSAEDNTEACFHLFQKTAEA